MKKKELLEKRADAVNELQEMRKLMDVEGFKGFSEEQECRWSQVNKDIDSADANIEKLDRADSVKISMEQVVEDREKSGIKIDDDTVNMAYNHWLREKSGVKSSQELIDASKKIKISARGNEADMSILRSAPKSVGEIEKRAQNSLVGSLGGYTCPMGFMQNIETALLAYGSMRGYANILRTENGNTIPWPTCNDTSNTGTWVGQNADMSSGTDVTFGSTDFVAHKVSSKVILVPLELIEDSAFDIVGYISERAGERIGRSMESAYATGDSVGQPTGLLTDATSGLTTAGATAITADEIIDLAHSVDPAYRNSPSCVYMMHDNVLKAVRKLKGGDGQYIWQPGLQAGIPSTLYGFPVAVNQSLTSTITASDKTMLFGDLNKYKIRDVRGVMLQVLRERYAEYGQVGILVIMRTDGKLLDAGTNPVKYMLQHA